MKLKKPDILKKQDRDIIKSFDMIRNVRGFT